MFTQNDNSFGLFPPASIYTKSALDGVAAAADAIDAGTSQSAFASRCLTGGVGSCKSSVKVGFIQAAASFTRSQCAGAPANARASGLKVATDSTGADLIMEIPASPSLTAAIAALATLREAGVNVITSCTYFSTVRQWLACSPASAKRSPQP